MATGVRSKQRGCDAAGSEGVLCYVDPLPAPDQLAFAKVRGWPWSPARVLPKEQSVETERGGVELQRLCFFLVDKTCAWVPAGAILPFEQHYERFIGAAYHNKVSDSRGDHCATGACAHCARGGLRHHRDQLLPLVWQHLSMPHSTHALGFVAFMLIA